jgi:hypothetical protein
MPFDHYPPLDEDHRRRSSERLPDLEFEWTPEHIRASASGKGLRWLFWLALVILPALVTLVPKPAYAPEAAPTSSLPSPALSVSNAKEPQSPRPSTPSRPSAAAPRSASHAPPRCRCTQ